MLDDELFEYLEGLLTENRKQRFLDVLVNRTNFLTVAMEDVYHLHNTSAVIRSCDAFGIQTLHVVEDKFGERLEKKIARGAEQWVDIARYPDTQSCIDHLKTSGYQIVATTPHDESNLVSDVTITKPTALFFGTEKEGVSDTVISQADSFLTIPMVGFSESLNISVAAAIILQKLTQQLRKSGLPWQLSQEEQLLKRMDWTKKSIKNVDSILKKLKR